MHVAHEHGKRTTAEAFSNYNESKPAVFKGARLGEGRISQFSASTGPVRVQDPRLPRDLVDQRPSGHGPVPVPR